MQIHIAVLCFGPLGARPLNGRGLIALCESHCVGGLTEQATNTHHLGDSSQAQAVCETLSCQVFFFFFFVIEVGC